MRQIVLDTETTGLEWEQGHRIIEIGCVELVNRRPTGNTFHYYRNPEREIDPGAQEVHGISAEFLADKPRFAEIAGELRDFLRGAELLIHNAPFDIGFIEHELSIAAHDCKSVSTVSTVLDTLELARDLHPGQRNNLDALCKRYEVDNSSRTLHGALLDAEILADDVIEVIVPRPFDRGVIVGAEIGDAFGFTCGLVGAGDMIRHDVDNDFHPVRMRTLDQCLEFLEAPGRIDGQVRIDAVVILDRVGRARAALYDVGVVVADAEFRVVANNGVMRYAGEPDMGRAEFPDSP